MSKRNEVEELAYSTWEEEGRPEGWEHVYLLEAQRLFEEGEIEHTTKGRHRPTEDLPDIGMRVKGVGSGSRGRPRRKAAVTEVHPGASQSVRKPKQAQ